MIHELLRCNATPAAATAAGISGILLSPVSALLIVFLSFFTAIFAGVFPVDVGAVAAGSAGNAGVLSAGADGVPGCTGTLVSSLIPY